MALTHQIPILQQLEGTRYLGVYIAPDGMMQTMENQIWKKVTLYTIAIQWTHMSRCEAGVIYWSCFIPALAYPLPATWLSDQFLDRIHQLSTATILNKMGFHQTLPWSMVFAPQSMGGVGLCNLSHEQVAKQIVTIIQHLQVRSQLGCTLEILICDYQLWAGIQGHVLLDMRPARGSPATGYYQSKKLCTTITSQSNMTLGLSPRSKRMIAFWWMIFETTESQATNWKN